MELRRYAECFEGFDGFEHVYDPLLDDFEPGMTTRRWRGARGARDGIRPLMAEITGRGETVDDACLMATFQSMSRRARPRRPRCRSRRVPGVWTPRHPSPPRSPV